MRQNPSIHMQARLLVKEAGVYRTIIRRVLRGRSEPEILRPEHQISEGVTVQRLDKGA
jgi:hypothetical protein